MNQMALRRQTDQDFTQTILRDDVGRGIVWANAQFADFVPAGRYVWVLDDDDMSIRETLVVELKTIAAEHDPDVIMTRMDHGRRGILPDDKNWGKQPKLGKVGSAAPVIERSLWVSCREAWQHGAYEADFNFIAAVFETEPAVYWHDVIASRVQRISMGAPE